MVILEDVADGYLLQCGCGARLSCRHGHGVIECPKCDTMVDVRQLVRGPQPTQPVAQSGYYY